MPSQFPYLPKYIYILISQIQSKYIFLLLCVFYLYHGFTAKSPILTYLLPLSFSTYLFLFSLSSFSSFNSSTPLCHSDQSFALLHFRNSFFCRSFSLMGTFLENRILSLRKLGLVNVVYGDRHNMV